MKKAVNPVHIGGASWVVAAALAAAVAPGAAQAQDRAAAEAGGPAAPGEDSDLTVGEIIVTAQKREERINDVPSSISVVNGDALEKLHVRNIQDLSGTVPNLVINSSGGRAGANIFVIRGLSPQGLGNTVSVMLDDVTVGGIRQSTAIDVNPVDLDRVEVLRGPQGTIFGANSLGGVVRFITKTPNLATFGGEVGADGYVLRDQAGAKVYGAINLPVVTDRLAIRVSGYTIQDPGYVDNALTGVRNENDQRRYGARAVALWMPSERFDVKLVADYSRIESDNSNTVRAVAAREGGVGPLRPGNFLDGKYRTSHYLPQPFTRDTQFYSGHANLDVGFADLSFTSSYTRDKYDSVTDRFYVGRDLTTGFNFQYLPALIFFGVFPPNSPRALGSKLNGDTRLSNYTEELRLSSKSGGTFEWLVGAYYAKQNEKFNSPFGAYDVNGADLPQYESLFAREFGTASYSEYAGFVNASVKPFAGFELTGGLRYSHVKTGLVDDLFIGNFVAAALPGVYQPGINRVVNSSTEEDVVTYVISPSYHFGKNTMVYGRIATGYRPGTPNPVIVGYPFIPPRTTSDRNTNYEVGIKTELLDKTLALDANLFLIDWSKIQTLTSTLDGLQTYRVNAGSARSRGFEISATYRPVRSLSLGANVGFTDAVFTSYYAFLSDGTSTNDPNLALGGRQIFYRVNDGTRLSGARRWTLSGSATYEFPEIGGAKPVFGVRARHLTPQYNIESISPNAVLTRSYTIVDLNLDVNVGRATLSAFVRNVGNVNRYETAGLAGDALTGQRWVAGTLVQPRLIGLGGRVSF
jgi:outer membrane receptor protein involved in Fe transport